MRARQTPKLRAALDQLIGEARGHLETALTLLPDVPPEVRPVFLPLALVGRDLERMSRADTDPFTPHVTSRLRTLWTLWRASRSRTSLVSASVVVIPRAGIQYAGPSMNYARNTVTRLRG